MKFLLSHHPARGGISPCPKPKASSHAGFTMIEIAICLAIIGFALVSILLVLPSGMNTQRDNREETVINQDATVLLEAIRSAARGADDLTNYVFAITNSWQEFDKQGQPTANFGVNSYVYTTANAYNTAAPYLALTNGANIVGLLSTPEYTDLNGRPISSIFDTFYRSNHVVALVRAISGLAAEKPPQDNPIMRDDTLTYRLFCVNAPMPVDTNTINNTDALFARRLAAAQRELRLTFLWPVLPNGKLGIGRQTFRTTVAGELTPVDYYNTGDSRYLLYFYQSQSFNNVP